METNVPTWSNHEYCRQAEMMPMGMAMRIPTMQESPTIHSVCGIRSTMRFTTGRRVAHERTRRRSLESPISTPVAAG